MAAEITDNPEEQRYEIRVDGALGGYAQYRTTPGQIAFLHTETDPAMHGRGLASQLIAHALEDARSRQLAVVPLCPFVAAYIRAHREHLDLVPEDQRPRFGL